MLEIKMDVICNLDMKIKGSEVELQPVETVDLEILNVELHKQHQ